MSTPAWPATPIAAYYDELLTAAGAWQDQGERLFGARRDLYHGQVDQLGERVAPVAAAFLAHWERQLSGLILHAESHHEALLSCVSGYVTTDAGASTELLRLLPYGSEARLGIDIGPGPGGPR